MEAETRAMHPVTGAEMSDPYDIRLLPIGIVEYGAAVDFLLETALHHDGGGAVGAAQVLLSAYDGGIFHLDVTDLCRLDDRHLSAALCVMQGRAMLGREPHNLVEDGDRRFAELWERWSSLAVGKRKPRGFF